MKLPNISGLYGVGKAVVAANRPEILFGTSLVTTLAAVVAAARGGYKSGYTVAEEDIKNLAVGGEKLDRKDIAKLTWLNYLPAAGLTGGALGATTGLHLVHVKEKKQLAAVAILAIEEGKKEAQKYKQEVLEMVGVTADEEDPKENKKAAKKGSLVAVENSDGRREELYLVRDVKTGRDIWSNKLRLESAMLELNQRLQNDPCELNQFYKDAGFNGIPEGEEYGWNKGEYVGLEWPDELLTVTDDGLPVRGFRFATEPTVRLWDLD